MTIAVVCFRTDIVVVCLQGCVMGGGVGGGGEVITLLWRGSIVRQTGVYTIRLQDSVYRLYVHATLVCS